MFVYPFAFRQTPSYEINLLVVTHVCELSFMVEAGRYIQRCHGSQAHLQILNMWTGFAFELFLSYAKLSHRPQLGFPLTEVTDPSDGQGQGMTTIPGSYSVAPASVPVNVGALCDCPLFGG